MKTVKELLESDMRIVSSDNFANLVQNSEYFHKIQSKLDVTFLVMDNKVLSNLTRHNVALIMKCDLAEHSMTKYESLSNYYMLPEKILKHIEQLEASYLNPFIERFQHFMDLSFEAGLPQAWKLYDANRVKLEVHEHIESDILQFKDLFQVFHTLFIGYSLASLLFLGEICFHDCISRLNFEFYTIKLRKYINQLGEIKQDRPRAHTLRKSKNLRKKTKRQRVDRPKVRRIEVEPVNFEN
jgi:hypothetical protein